MSDQIEAVEFYWRQGCGFCMSLERGLNKAGIPINKHNIWEDPANAERVRSVARGNETVPTVFVAETALVNPRVGEVIDVLESEAPHLLPEETARDNTAGRLKQRLFGS
ncbi:MAG: glutaredoxin domain-containing protein [Acidimicrobiales bacterium]